MSMVIGIITSMMYFLNLVIGFVLLGTLYNDFKKRNQLDITFCVTIVLDFLAAVLMLALLHAIHIRGVQ